MNIIKFERNTEEDEILKQLKGKSFIAISAYSNNDGTNTYNFFTNNMPNEGTITACELMKKQILDKFQNNE